MRFALPIFFLVASPLWAAGTATETAPRFFLGTDSGAAYSGIEFGTALGGLSFGRPRSALDDPDFTAPGLALATARSLAAAAARRESLGAGLLFESDPIGGLSFSSSWHEKQGEDADLVAVSGRYVPEPIDRIGLIAVYGGAETDGDGDVYRLGTSLTRGRATAGLDLTSEGGPNRRRVQGVYVGVEVSDGLSLGLSREVEYERGGDTLPPRLGLGAAYDFGRGQTVSGAIGDVTGEEPSFGLMLGLQF